METKSEFPKAKFIERLMEVTSHATNKKIAEVAGTSEATVSKWLNILHTSSYPSAIHLMALSEEYACSVDYLLGTENNTMKAEATYKNTIKKIVSLCNTLGTSVQVSIDKTQEREESDPYFIPETLEYTISIIAKDYISEDMYGNWSFSPIRLLVDYFKDSESIMNTNLPEKLKEKTLDALLNDWKYEELYGNIPGDLPFE